MIKRLEYIYKAYIVKALLGMPEEARSRFRNDFGWDYFMKSKYEELEQMPVSELVYSLSMEKTIYALRVIIKTQLKLNTI